MKKKRKLEYLKQMEALKQTINTNNLINRKKKNIKNYLI